METEETNFLEQYNSGEIIKNFACSSDAQDMERMYLESIKNFPTYSNKEVRNLIKRYQNGERNLKNTIIEAYLKFVVYYIKHKKSYKNAEEFLEYIQQGNLGLLEALDRFNPDLGYAFSTYAKFWIQKETRRKDLDGVRGVSVSMAILENMQKYRKLKQKYLILEGRKPTEEETLRELSMTDLDLQKVLIVDTIYDNVDSLNRTVREDSDGVLEVMDFYISPKFQNIENIVIDKEKGESLQILLTNLKHWLTPSQYYVLFCRYVNDSIKTQQELADELLVSRSYVGEIETKALKKCRNIQDIERKRKFDYTIPLEKLIPIPYRKKVALYHLKTTLSTFEYALVYYFIYLKQNKEDYFISVDPIFVERKINDLKIQYQRILADDTEYKKIEKSKKRDEVLEADIQAIYIKKYQKVNQKKRM